MRIGLGFLTSWMIAAVVLAGAPAHAQKKARTPKVLTKTEVAPVAQAYAALVYKTYDELLGANQKLLSAAQKFVAAPTNENLEATKEAWKAARLIYSETEAFRFYGGPIDKADGAPAERGPEPLMNAWPIDEAYLDYVKGNENAGLIQNPARPITEDALIDANEKDGERNISTGYHAIEFLLWGQDLSTTSPGQRPVSDYQPTNKFAARRGQVLVTLTGLLVKQSEALKTAWAPSAPQTVAFMAEAPDEILRKILVGVTTLSADEMAGERLTVALEKKDPEHEQDCFSDFSLEDMKANQRGIEKVLVQSGLMDLFQKGRRKETLGLRRHLDIVSKNIASIPAPFDAILVDEKNPNRKKVETAIASLQKQARLIDGITQTWGLELNVQAE
ncbi:MAG: hypothetical protein KF681_15080 [Bdellovibrionaceae bacterium]|nr:hypothetical protein [Pseudobdellovibrionaceae bacterium]